MTGGRQIRLVVCDGAGAVIGRLPAYDVEPPWWPEVESVISAARRLFGAEVSVLRLLDAEAPSATMGGPVTYLAELRGSRPPALLPADAVPPGLVGDTPHRAAWARPGGVAAAVAWADAVLALSGRRRVGPAVQVKTWNLSLLLRLPTAGGDVWCKAVPPFMAHEGTVIAMVAADEPSLAPRLLGVDAEHGRVLLEEIPGADQWEAPESLLVEMVRRWVALQNGWTARVPELLAAGLPEWSARTLPGQVDDVLSRPGTVAALSSAERAGLNRLAAALPARLAALEACGLPVTLVHGDFHVGNWRYDGTSLVLLDWADSGVGHPLLDTAAFLPRIADAAVRDRVAGAWVKCWRAARPGSDPARAAELIAPVAALRQAVIYRRFLDGIEPSEHRYHEADVPRWLRHALAAAEPGSYPDGT